MALHKNCRLFLIGLVHTRRACVGDVDPLRIEFLDCGRAQLGEDLQMEEGKKQAQDPFPFSSLRPNILSSRNSPFSPVVTLRELDSSDIIVRPPSMLANN